MYRHPQRLGLLLSTPPGYQPQHQPLYIHRTNCTKTMKAQKSKRSRPRSNAIELFVIQVSSSQQVRIKLIDFPIPRIFQRVATVNRDTHQQRDNSNLVGKILRDEVRQHGFAQRILITPFRCQECEKGVSVCRLYKKRT